MLTTKQVEDKLILSLEITGMILPTDRNLAHRVIKLIAPTVLKMIQSALADARRADAKSKI
jgi:hypothetical protein